MGVGSRIRNAWKAAALLGVGVAGGGAALAVAAIPDSGGAIHACYSITTTSGTTVPQTSGTNLVRIIDPSAGQTCAPFQTDNGTGEAALSWNQTGPAGPQGPPGATGATGATGPTGSQGTAGANATVASGGTLTLAGGQVVTVGTGSAVTIAPPAIKPNAPAIGRVTLGGLRFNVLAYDVAPASGAGAAAGKVKFNEFVITKKTDSTSPLIFKSCASGKHFPAATIVLSRKAGAKPKDYLKITLTEVVISSVQSQSSGPSGEAPTESLSLNFTKVEYKNLKQ